MLSWEPLGREGAAGPLIVFGGTVCVVCESLRVSWRPRTGTISGMFVQGLVPRNLGKPWRPESNAHRGFLRARWLGQRGVGKDLRRGLLPVDLLLVSTEQQLEAGG